MTPVEPAPGPVATPTTEAAPGARHGRLLWLTLGVALVVWVVDQVSKWLVVQHLEGKPAVEVVGKLLQLEMIRNSGAAFSMGTSATYVFTAIAVAVVVVVLRTARRLGSVWWAVALGGLLGGAVGNLTDRVFRAPGFPNGHVVDFISLPHFAIFNAADMAIVGSAVLMVVLSLLGVELDGSHRRGAGATP